jgi:hypothetical protein
MHLRFFTTCGLFIALFSSFLFLIGIESAQAYPEFIGYGYSSCLTCHDNGLGGGPLNDYGRALWSSEISSHWVYPKSMSDDDIAAQSGFLGSVELPYWIRPSLDYRGLYYRYDPGSSTQDQSKFYEMQADVGLAIQDKMSKYLGVLTYGRQLTNAQYGQAQPGITNFAAREYYVRAELAEQLYIYVGLMEKAFGLRNVDHESFQRMYEGFNIQSNTADGMGESQGVIIHKISDKWELAGGAFIGNPADDSNYKQTGASLTGDYEVGENKRLGASVMTEKNSLVNKNLAAVHYRQALAKGSAIMAEWGLIQNQPASGSAQVGSYDLIEALILLTPGYNLKTTIERYNDQFNSSSTDQWRWSAGFLMFPLPRLELRAEVVNGRSLSGSSSEEDSWVVEGQVHVSL